MDAKTKHLIVNILITTYLAYVGAVGFCDYSVYPDRSEKTDCEYYSTPKCREKCIISQFSPGYSCKIPLNECTLQCSCSYFHPDYVETTIIPETTPEELTTSDLISTSGEFPSNECLSYGHTCNIHCKTATDFCQVFTPIQPKSCVCHHWINGSSLIGDFNDFLSIKESLFSDNGLFRLTMDDYWHLALYNITTGKRITRIVGFKNFNNTDRFTLTRDKTFGVQSFGLDSDHNIVTNTLAVLPQMARSALMKVEDDGRVAFYSEHGDIIYSTKTPTIPSG